MVPRTNLENLDVEYLPPYEPSPTRINFPLCNGKRTSRSTSRTTPRGSAKERGPGSFRLPIRRTLAVKRKGRQVFRASLKVRQYATFIANAIGRIRRNNGETLRSLLRSAKKALDGATYTENMEREEGRKSTIRVIERSRVERWIWASRREEEGRADGSFMQGAIVNQSRGGGGPWVESRVSPDRKSGSDRRRRGGGTINIVFATILGTFAAGAAALWASSREGKGKKFRSCWNLFRGRPFLRPRFRASFYFFGRLWLWPSRNLVRTNWEDEIAFELVGGREIVSRGWKKGGFGVHFNSRFTNHRQASRREYVYMVGTVLW